MRNLKLVVTVVATMALVFTSCEKEETNEVEQTNLQSRQPLATGALGEVNASARTASGVPETIDELREDGVAVSSGLASFLSNNFRILLFAGELSVSDPNRLRRAGFFESEIAELILINSGYNAILERANNIQFSPEIGPISAANLSQIIGEWEVDSFKTGAVTTRGGEYALVNDLSRIVRGASAPASANGFIITSTEFSYTNNGQVLETYSIDTDSEPLFIINNNERVRLFGVVNITDDGQTLVPVFSASLTRAIPIGSYRLKRK